MKAFLTNYVYGVENIAINIALLAALTQTGALVYCIVDGLIKR